MVMGEDEGQFLSATVMITVFRSRRVLPLSLALLCALACGVAPARADYASDTQFLDSVRAVLDAKEGTPAERVARYDTNMAARTRLFKSFAPQPL